MSVTSRLTVMADAAAAGAASFWARSLGTRAGLAQRDLYRLDLCVTELVTNIATYAYDRAGGVIELCAETSGADDVRIQISDSGRAFDPCSAPHIAARAHGDIDIGGLGIELVRGFVDDCSYVRREEWNVFTMTIRRSDAAAQGGGAR